MEKEHETTTYVEAPVEGPVPKNEEKDTQEEPETDHHARRNPPVGLAP